jgi:alcohol dehydrogenase, propanol-preferring
VLIEVSVCGVCHTDLHTVEGELTPTELPRIIGHQIVGRVAETGEDVEGWKVGDRIGVPWLASSCGRCRHCLGGNENLCERARFTGLHVDGGYAEFTVAEAAYGTPLPSEFDDAHAAPLLCAGIIGFRSLRLSGYRKGKTLALFGFGASAHIALQLAVADGSRVAVYSRSESHRRLARELGASWCGESGEQPPFPVECAVTFAPVGSIVADALAILDRGGTVAINAVHMSAIPELAYEALYHERTIRSVANATRRDAAEFFEAAARAGLRTEVTEFGLEQANEVLERLKRSEVQGAAVLRVG